MSASDKQQSRDRSSYRAGYYAGSRRTWPAHRPPMPPHPRIRALMAAMQALRDCADGLCASLSEDDGFVIELGPKIDAFDAEMTGLSDWLLRQESQP